MFYITSLCQDVDTMHSTVTFTVVLTISSDFKRINCSIVEVTWKSESVFRFSAGSSSPRK